MRVTSAAGRLAVGSSSTTTSALVDSARAMATMDLSVRDRSATPRAGLDWTPDMVERALRLHRNAVPPH